MIHPSQVRAARALLGINQDDLARLASVSVITVKRLEASSGELRGSVRTLAKIKEALVGAGVMFIDQDETAGLGVRLRKSGATK